MAVSYPRTMARGHGVGASPPPRPPIPSASKAPTVDFEGLLGGVLGGGGSAQPKASGQLTQKNGKFYDSAGKEWKLEGGRYVPAGGGGKAGGAAPGSMDEVLNRAQKDPRLDFLGRKVQERIENPERNTRRAIDAAGLALRDLQSGQERELDASLAARGISGSGIGQAARQQMSAETAGRVGGVARDIELQRARDEDAFMLGSTGALGAAGEAARADRSLAGQLWIENEQNKRAQEMARLQQTVAVLELLSNFAGAA